MTKIQHISPEALATQINEAKKMIKDLQSVETSTLSLIDAARHAIAKAEAWYELLTMEYLRRMSSLIDARLKDSQ